MKQLFFIAILTPLFTLSSFADQEAPQSHSLMGAFCMLDESKENTFFYCKDPNSGTTHVQEIEPIYVSDMVRRLEESGGEIVSSEDFVARVTEKELLEMIAGPDKELNQQACVQKIYYRTNQFNDLPVNGEITNQLKTLARALHEAGVCDLPVKQQNFNSINIRSQQDVLHHFLCISNSESVFGTRNIGLGGRGPWGIHPMHNQKSGTRAFVDGRTVTLKRNGVCYPSQAIVRTPAGVEIKESNRYKNYDVILDNAKCAMTLYKAKGFTDWGTKKAWGSNRHCSKTTRDRLQFFKHIGALGCCTDACRARFND
jgi:hypothetical protein